MLVSLSLCISSSALCTSSEEKPGEPSYFQPTSLSLSPLQVQMKQRKTNTTIWRDVLYILYTHISETIRHLTFRCACTASPVSWCIPVYKRCIAQLHRVMKSWWRYEHFCNGRTLYQWIHLCTMLNLKEGSLVKLCDRFHLVGMMTERSYFWCAWEINTSHHVFLFVESLDRVNMTQNINRPGLRLLIEYPWVFENNSCIMVKS